VDLELAGRRAFVTASSGGIGAAVARRLADEGCALLVHGRDVERAHGLAAELGADVVLGDLADPQAAASVAASARAWGADVLVNNAGPFVEHDWDAAEPADWLATFDANVVSAVRMIQAAMPTMRARGWGRIVNIGSRAATTPLPNMVDYSAAKAAVVNMTTALARHLAGTGITSRPAPPRGAGPAHGRRSRRASSPSTPPTPADGSATPTTSPPRWRSWPARSRATSTASTCASTAASPTSRSWPAGVSCRP
jgi:3-oxoacyl-[acyl-carrier protein] reductase